MTSDHIRGYEKIVNGHLATAETVAAGLADCGIGIEAAARASDLDFLPLNEEPYDLVIPITSSTCPPSSLSSTCSRRGTSTARWNPSAATIPRRWARPPSSPPC